MKTKMRKILIIFVWIIIWQIVATIINKPILFASFFDCLKALFTLLKTNTFYTSILHTVLFIIMGIVISYLLAIIFAFISFKYQLIYDFLQPILLVLKATPIACFSILILIWLGSEYLSIIVSFIVLFPQVYYATINGLKNRDKNLLEMAKVNRMKKIDILLFIDRLSITPYLLTVSDSAISMAIKSCIAAELIGLASNSIGQQLYYSKLYLDTAELFCYSFVIILISFLFEKITLKLIKTLGGNYD